MSDDNTITPPFNPSEKQKETIKWANDSFIIMWDNNRRSYTQFRGNTLQTQLDAGRKLINLWSQPRADGRSNIKSVSSLNKLMAILARTVLNRPKVVTTAQTKDNFIDAKRGEVIDNIYEASENYDRAETVDTEYFFEGFDCATDGTLIVFKGYDAQTHTQKNITSYDPDTGDVEFEEEEYTTDKCFSETIKPEDFYIWSPYIRDVQQQPRVAWRTVFEETKFKWEFQDYKNEKFVKGRASTRDTEDTFFKDEFFDRIEEKQVEVLRIFDRFNDRMVIMANRIPLYDGPIPFNNGQPKRYPFAKTINSPFAGGKFFWGMSLPFKLGGDAKALDTLFNLGIEQSKLAVNPPQLTTAENEIEDNILMPGRVITLDNFDAYREMEFKSPDASWGNMIDRIGQNISLSSVDEAGQGQAQKGVTARGQVIAEENARKLLGVFNLMMENIVLQKAQIGIPNVIQFLIIPGATFRTETEIEGEQGVQEIEVFGNNEEANTAQSSFDMIEAMAEASGVNLEKLGITPNYLKNIKYSTKIIKESAFEQAKSLAQTLEIEYVSTIANFFPNIFQSASEIIFKDLSKVFDKDPERILKAVKQNTQINAQQIQQLQGGSGQGQGAGQAVKQLAGGASLGRLAGVES